MPLPDMNSYERRADFVAICLAVPCPLCRAVAGAPCRFLGLPQHVVSSQKRHPHMERKYAGIQAFEHPAPAALPQPDGDSTTIGGELVPEPDDTEAA